VGLSFLDKIGLVERDELEIKNQISVSWHQPGESPVSVGLAAGDGDLGPLADAQLGHALVQPGNHLLAAQLELEGFAAVS